MLRIPKYCWIVLALLSIGTITFADKGVGKKARNKTLLNISTNANTTLKNSIALNIKSGLNYKGSLSATNKSAAGLMQNNSLITFQKGNTTYIIPYKQKTTLTEIKQGYTGIKLIIRSRN